MGYSFEATRTPTTKDLYWAAGFLEGEGHFRKTRTTHQATADQCNPEPVAKLLEIFGGRVYKKPRTYPHNDVWVWIACGARARGIMLTLYPLLSTKRQEQIRKAANKSDRGLSALWGKQAAV